MTTIERQLATIRSISEIKPIKNADVIELAIIDGWQTVVKKGEFVKDQAVVFVEVDSWVPHELAPFLSKGKEPREFEGVNGERLKTIKLRGELSQGLVLPTSIVGNVIVGENVTYLLGIKKYEKPLPACLRGTAKGNFPSEVQKTDQTRIQNLTRNFEEIQNGVWEVTEKLHGSSCTFYLDKEDVFHVCSRNLDLKFDENNAYWKAAIKYNIEEKMKAWKMQGLAIQGELIGEGINGNQYGKDLEFYVFDIFNTWTQKYLPPNLRKEVSIGDLELLHVPVIQRAISIKGVDINYLLNLANFKSNLNGSTAEGLVFKEVNQKGCITSFKIINNKWLLDNDE